MKILLWHGYLLSGSGSNVYTANVARSWRSRGHEVLVLCQERHAGDLAFVDDWGTVDASGADLRLSRPTEATAGWCGVARPEIGPLLPVYVYDDYEGLDVKVFPDLSDEELDRYVRLNVESLVAAISAFTPDVSITGHEVMGPYIARLACEATGTRYIAKLHGSALEYAVKKQERYREFARLGLSAADRVVGGSHYMVREAAAHIPGWEDKAAVVNPGCDVDLFRPLQRSVPSGTVGFVGKFIGSKGVHHLLTSLPLVPSATRAVIVGYGALDRDLRDLAEGIRRADVQASRTALASVGTHADALRSFQDGFPNRNVGVTFTGRLEHEPLSRLLPTFDVLAVPSVVPEAFGMVAAEAAAAGVLPVVPDHSGIGEAGAAIEEAIGRPGFLTYPADRPVTGLAEALERVLSLPIEDRMVAESAAVALARSRWSWDRVADTLLSLAVR